MQVETMRGLVRGYWSATGYGPCQVSDPAKVRYLLGLGPKPRTLRGLVRLERAVLPVSVVRRFLADASRANRRQFERLLSGGNVLWREAWQNVVTDAGQDHLLDVTLSAATQDTTWFVFLTDGTPTVAETDTLASHAGWVEVTAYDEAARVAWSDGGVSGQSVSNSASPATFTISTNGTTVGGAGLSAENTKGGTTGILYAVGAFTAGDKLLDDNDTIDVTSTATMADDGV